MTTQLFLRTEPIPGESIYGYLTRLGRVLGYTSPLWVFDRFPGRFRHKTTRHLLLAQNLGFLAEALNISANALDEMRFPLMSGRAFTCRGQIISQQDIFAGQEYYCPLCIRDGGTHYLIWHLAFVTICPRHNCRLISQCQACGRPVDMGMISQGTCRRCAADISVSFLDPDRPGAAVRSLLSLIGGLTGHDAIITVPEPLDGLGLSGALNLVMCLGRSQENNPPTGRNIARNMMEQRLIAGFDICQNWAKDIPALLDREFRRPRSPETSDFGFFHTHFLRNQNPKVHRIATAAVEDYKKSLLKAGTDGGRPIDIDEYEKLSDVAKALGLPELSLLRTASAQDSRFPRITWNRATYLHKTEVDWFRRSQALCISCKEVSTLLNIHDRHQVQALYDHRVFPIADQALLLDHRTHAFFRPAVEAFIRYIEEIPERQSFDPEVEADWRTAKAMYMVRHNSSVDFVKAIVGGRILPAGRLAGKKGLPSLFFRKNAVQVAACQGVRQHPSSDPRKLRISADRNVA